MNGFFIAGLVFSLLILLSFVRVGGEAEYSKAGIFVRIRVGFLSFLVFPFPKKKEKKTVKKNKKSDLHTEKTDKVKKPSEKKGGSLTRLQHYLPLVGEAAGMMKKRIRIDTLYMDLLMASPDAATAAIAYGYANMALGILWPVLEENFEIRDHQIRTGVDFETDSPTIYLKAAFSARINQLVFFGCRLAWIFLNLYREEKREKMQKEAI